MQPPPALGTLTLEVPFYGARRLGGKWPPVAVSAVYAKEPSPPQGEATVEGLLLTSLPVRDFAGAWTVMHW